MMTKLQLRILSQKNMKEVRIEELKDISKVVIDKNKCVAERIASFIEQVGNPYLFKVGNTPVKVSFTPNGPTFQKSLETLLTKNI